MDATTLTVTAGAALVGFLTAALLGKVLIPVLHRLKFGQTIREEGPAWHRAKQGTPTMGGVLFIIGSLAATSSCANSFWEAVRPRFRFLTTLI